MIRLCLMALFASTTPVFYAVLYAVFCAVCFAHDIQNPLPAFKFESDIRPILREYFLDCHGASDQIEGSLDLRLVRFML